MSGPIPTVFGAYALLGRHAGLTRVRCNGVAALGRGAPIFISGESGGLAVAYGALAGYFPATHILLQALETGQEGWAARYVEWGDYDTAGLSPGPLYVSAASPGAWTQSVPDGVAWHEACGIVLGEGRVVLFAPGIRMVAPASVAGTVTFYVRPTGSDANSGTSVNQAWATLSHALSATANRIVQDSATLRINISGTFPISQTQEIVRCARTVGAGKVEVYGDPATPSNARLTGLANGGNTFGIASVSNVSGNTWRYSLAGSPDISAVEAGRSRLTAWGCGQSGNNGQFTVAAFDNVNKTIDVTNAAGAAESPCGGSGAVTAALAAVLKVSGIRGTNLVFNGVTVEGGCGDGAEPGSGGGWWIERSDVRIQNSLARYSALGIHACDASRVDVMGTCVERNGDALRADRLSFLYCSGTSGSNFGRVISSMNSYVKRDGVTGSGGNVESNGGRIE